MGQNQKASRGLTADPRQHLPEDADADLWSESDATFWETHISGAAAPGEYLVSRPSRRNGLITI